jgi:hypothetical protein
MYSRPGPTKIFDCLSRLTSKKRLAAKSFPAGLAQLTALPRVLAFLQQRLTRSFRVHGVQYPSFVSGFQIGSLSVVLRFWVLFNFFNYIPNEI